MPMRLQQMYLPEDLKTQYVDKAEQLSIPTSVLIRTVLRRAVNELDGYAEQARHEAASVSRRPRRDERG